MFQVCAPLAAAMSTHQREQEQPAVPGSVLPQGAGGLCGDAGAADGLSRVNN